MFDLGQRYFKVILELIENFQFLIFNFQFLRYINLSPENESLGLLVLLGFDITALTPVAYQRRSLRRPLRDILS